MGEARRHLVSPQATAPTASVRTLSTTEAHHLPARGAHVRTVDASSCPAGSYTNASSGACVACPAGSSSGEVGASSAAACVLCQVGNYSGAGAAACDECPLGSVTAGNGSVGVDECTCARGEAWFPTGMTCGGTCGCVSSSGVSGVIDDGNAGDNYGRYANNLDCWWIVSGVNPTLTLTMLYLHYDDAVEVDESSDPSFSTGVTQLARIVGLQTSIHDSGIYSAGGSEGGHYLRLRFTSNADGIRYGFDAAWSVGRSCAACDAGTYKVALGHAACDACPAGRYSGAVGTSNASTCAVCLAGSYSLAGAAACVKCLAGSYSGAAGASNASTCAPCPAGSYSAAVGATTASTCVVCQAGNFSDAGAGACVACQAGSYSLAANASTCAPCPAGSASDAEGATSAATCETCPTGSFAAAGAGVCGCLPGSYLDASVTSGSACVTCPAGTYSGDGVGACEQCPATTVTAGPGSANASDCVCAAGGTLSMGMTCEGTCGCVSSSEPSGVLSDGPVDYVNDADCSWLLRGFNATVTFTAFSIDTYDYVYVERSADADFSTGVTLLATLTGDGLPSRRTYSAGGDYLRLRLTSNYKGQASGFDASWSVGSCAPCDPGTYKDALGIETCALCPAGSFSAAVGAADASTCSPCPAGSYSAAGAEACDLCHAGSYAVAPGALSCAGCPAGSSTAVEGASDAAACVPCEVGTYKSGSGAGTCVVCPAALVTAGPGSVSVDDCTCTSGEAWSPTGLRCGGTCGCTNSSETSGAIDDGGVGSYGYYANNADCWWIINGINPTVTFSMFYTWNSADFVEVDESSDASFSSGVTQLALLYSLRSPGTYSAGGAGEQYLRLRFTSDGTNPYKGFDATWSAGGFCTSCHPGTYKHALGNASCLPCPAGGWSGAGASSCVQCPAGSYSDAVGASNVSTCALCPAGTYSDTLAAINASVCLACAAGSYSAAEGATNSSTCTPCPADTCSSTKGASTASTCGKCLAPRGNCTARTKPAPAATTTASPSPAMEEAPRGPAVCKPGVEVARAHAGSIDAPVCDDAFQGARGAAVCKVGVEVSKVGVEASKVGVEASKVGVEASKASKVGVEASKVGVEASKVGVEASKARSMQPAWAQPAWQYAPGGLAPGHAPALTPALAV
ncbi:hypothetical protein T484DRAFT_1843660 [Baffinella frigidus]|nr:hypothetical protein T484DRAFT_1843660 [Cryptophyta sp. CCMP2293]